MLGHFKYRGYYYFTHMLLCDELLLCTGTPINVINSGYKLDMASDL